MSAPTTHSALVTVGPRLPLEIHTYPTVAPGPGEVLVRVQWTSSTPLHLHQADGGLLVNPPMIMGSSCAGVVVQVGPPEPAAKDVDSSTSHNLSPPPSLQPGDRVFGFTRQSTAEKAHQEYVTAPSWCFGLVPQGFSLQEAITLPENLVTVFNTMWADLSLPTPLPKPDNYVPEAADTPILVWGASSSVGQFALQVLRWYGYRHVVATASARHHKYLMEELGAKACYDYRDGSKVVQELSAAQGAGRGKFKYIIDCIGSRDGSLAPISRIAHPESTVAVMLPVIVTHATRDRAPQYAMDVREVGLEWADEVTTKGVRTHFYWKNDLFRAYLQSRFVPELLAQGIVRPNRFRVVEGKDMQERATRALSELRDGTVSGEKLVWRVCDD